MKKLFVFAIAAGMFFVACNGGKSEGTDSTATAVDTMAAAPVTEPAAAPADSAATVDSAAAPVADSAAAAAPAPAAH
ncbi:hypothetical protein [Chitinophaga sp. CB10]|uniref:hypothetical protein n=1 Tax=Chitinophaga sp. CB10 TaxID=1891659 RepID=UPI0025B8714A|nr:hypothetical protein [Chitinophaga sp. CB10]